MSRPRWVPVAAFGAVYEAEMAAARLEDAGIPALVRSSHVGIFGPGFAGPTPQGIQLLVPEERLEEAREVLA
jgi:hypothetical protein